MPDRSIAKVTSSADLSLGSTVIPMRFQTSEGTSPEMRTVVCVDGWGWAGGVGGSGGTGGVGGGIGGVGFGSSLGCNASARVGVSRYTSVSNATSSASTGVLYHTRS